MIRFIWLLSFVGGGLVAMAQDLPPPREWNPMLERASMAAMSQVVMQAAILGGQPETTLHFHLTNQSEALVNIEPIHTNRNGLYLEIPQLNFALLNTYLKSWLSPPDIVAPGEAREWLVKLSNTTTQFDSLKPGMIVIVRWEVNHHRSAPFVFVCAGESDPPVTVRPCHPADGKRLALINRPAALASPVLALAHHAQQPPGFAFLFVNGSEDSVKVAAPLSPASCVIAIVPKLQYSRKLVMPGSKASAATVAPGQMGEWRLPWQTVLDLIPKAELGQILAAGGDLDLVWQVNERASQVLPIKLPPPAAPPPE